MNTSLPTTHVPIQFWFRWAARAGGAVMFVTWLELVFLEFARQGTPDLRNFGQPLQAAMLLVVFAGYVIGWRSELIGGLLSIIGTIAFGVFCRLTVGALPSIAFVWFAVPGLLYLSAWYTDLRHGKLVL